MNPSMKVRQVADGELDALSDMDRRIFGALAYPRFVLQQLFDVFHHEILVAGDNERLRGYSIAVPSTTPGLACFLALGVDPEVRGQGLGRLLARTAIDRLQEHRIDRVSLVVEPHNVVAISLYKSLGFVLLQRLENYYGPGEHRLLFELTMQKVSSPTNSSTTVRASS